MDVTGPRKNTMSEEKLFTPLVGRAMHIPMIPLINKFAPNLLNVVHDRLCVYLSYAKRRYTCLNRSFNFDDRRVTFVEMGRTTNTYCRGVLINHSRVYFSFQLFYYFTRADGYSRVILYIERIAQRLVKVARYRITC